MRSISNIGLLPAISLLAAAVFLGSCKTKSSADTRAPSAGEAQGVALFEDAMDSGWKEKWFLDGQNATLEHRDGGLLFSAGTVTKQMDPEAYHAHHAVLWTKQVFEGDLRISYEMTRVDQSDYGTTLLYLQAQGVGTGTHPEDITKWNQLRETPAMNEYFENMDLISLSFRETLRCKRYPWKDPQGDWYPKRGLIEPMANYPGIIPGKTYQVEVEKRAGSVRLHLSDRQTKETILDQNWDTTQIPTSQQPKLVTKGRIGLRHMSTRQMIYRHFKVEEL